MSTIDILPSRVPEIPVTVQTGMKRLLITLSNAFQIRRGGITFTDIAVIVAFVFLVVISLLLRYPQILSKTLHPFLHRANIVKDAFGKKALSGPSYQWPHGNTLEKLFQHRQKSWEWENQYGKIYRIWSGMFTEVVITTPEDVQKFFSDASEHRKTLTRRGGWVLKNVMGHAVGFINGPRWKVLRKVFDPLLTNAVAMSQISKINGAGKEFVAHIKESRIDEKTDENSFRVNAAKTLMPYPLFETSRVIYGDLTEEEKAGIFGVGQIFMYISFLEVHSGLARTWFSKYWYTPTQLYLNFLYDRRWKALNKKMIRDRAGRPDLPIIKLQRDVDAGRISKDELLHTVAEAVHANLDITTHVLVSSCIMLADDPKTQDELVAEIDMNKHDQDKYLSKTNTLLHYIILEALRLQPVLPFSIPEEASTDKIMSGYLVPAGTTVISDTYGINVRNPFWGPDSKEYRPMRFQGLTPNDLRYNLYTFGYGSRKCMGQWFADKQLRSLLMHLYDNFVVECDAKSKVDGAFKTDKTTWVGMFDVELILKERARRAV